MNPIRVYCEYHLGDLFCLAHLLRYCAKTHPENQFELFMHRCYLPELLCFAEDASNFTLWDLEKGIPEGAINGWKQAEDFWASHPLKHDYAAFTKRYYRRMIRKMGLVISAPDLLFDLPCLKPHSDWGIISMLRNGFDVLLVNSAPCSGQFLDYSHDGALDEMARALAKKNRVLTTKKVDDLSCTRDADLDCAQIAGYATHIIPNLVMVSTGPSWLTMNVFSKPKYRLIMCQNEHVNLVPHVWARSIGQAMGELSKEGLI